MTSKLQLFWMAWTVGVALVVPVGFGAASLFRKLAAFIRALRARAVAAKVIERNAVLFCEDLRRPYATLSGLAQALEREGDPAARAALLARFAQDSRLSLGRVDQVLESLAELGSKRPAGKENVEPAALIEQALRRLPKDALAARVQLRTLQTRKLRGDAGRLVAAMVHLLDNATAAAGPDGRLWIECRDLERGDRPYVAVTIGNSGSYIPEAQREVIFEPFFSVGKGEAPGLGLAVVRRIAESHGGRIDVRSSQETGTEFTMTLPATMSPSRYRPQCVSAQATVQSLVDALAPAYAWPLATAGSARWA